MCSDNVWRSPFFLGEKTLQYLEAIVQTVKKKKKDNLQRENERIMNKCSKPLPFGNLGTEDTGVALTILAIC